MLPGDIASLVSANIGVGADSAIEDAAGHNALTGLASIDSQSSLSTDSDLSLTGSLVADGNVSLGGPNLTVAGTYTQAQGTLSLGGTTKLRASQVQIDHGAFLEAEAGTIAGNLVSDGSVAAAGFAATRVTGNYTQAVDASLDSGFAGPLAVTGEATLAGAVSSAEDFPRTGDTSPVITFGSRSGDFTSVGLGFTLLTTARAVDVVTTPQIAASPTTVAPGQQVTVNGASFGFGSIVRIFLDRVGGAPLASASAGYRGLFAATVTIPASAKAGSHELIAVGTDGSRAEIPITVS